MRPVLEQLDRLAGIWYEEDLRAGRVPAEVQVESYTTFSLREPDVKSTRLNDARPGQRSNNSFARLNNSFPS
jgi:hypothetical protein